MGNRIITMEGLVEFCKSMGTFSYNAKETGHPLAVSTFGVLEYSSEGNKDLMDVTLKSCHIGLNRNGSHISEENMNKAIPSFANKPILAEIVKDDDGNLDFGTHAIEAVEDENGDLKYRYIEKPVGIVPESYSPRLVYDKEYDKTYLYVNGKIFKLYGNETADILTEKKGTKVSIEIDIENMAWDAKNNWLDIIDFTFSGVTLLGEKIGEGMLGSRCDVSDFSQYQSFDYSKEINEMKSRLKIIEARYKNSKEGGNQELGKLDELLAQYGVTVEDLDFDYEGMSDEELEAKFKEVFDDDDSNTPSEGDNSEGDNSEGANEGISNAQKTEDDSSESKPKKQTDDFDLSLQDKINALYNLVAVTYEEVDNEWYGVTVYDSYVVMHGYFKGNHYKQNYKEEKEEFSLVGDRVQVYEQFLTQEEMDALESMKSEFAALKEFKSNYEQNELKTKRENLISDTRFDSIRDTEEFAAVVKDAENYSLEELETKFKLIFADIELANRTFTEKPISKQNSGKMFTIPSKGTNPVESKYGGIFLDK